MSAAIAGPYGGRSTPLSHTIPAISSAGVTSNAGVVDPAAVRAPAVVAEASHLAVPPELDRDRLPRRCVRVECAERRRQVEGHPVPRRDRRQPVRPHLVRPVPVRRDPVRPRDDRAHLPRRDQRGRCRVRQERPGNPELSQLPHRQPRPLQQRPCLRRVAALDAPRPPGLCDHRERRPLPSRRETARVAVRQDRPLQARQIAPVTCKRRVPFPLSRHRKLREAPQRRPPLLLPACRRRHCFQGLIDHRPEVHCRRARRLQLRGGLRQCLRSRPALLPRDRHPAGAGYAQQRRSPYSQRADRLRHGGHCVQPQVALLVWKQRLVQDLDAFARQDADRGVAAHGAVPSSGRGSWRRSRRSSPVRPAPPAR